MKKFLQKIARFFWSRGFLKFVLWTITLIILFYVEEDWRGARMWAATKAKWEAKGESFDYNRLVPPPIPDDQNLAAIPLFKMESDPGNKGNLEPLALQRALRTGLPGNELPSSGNWQRGQLPDMKKIRVGIAAAYAEAFKAPPPSPDALKQLDALYPFIADLRAASANRKYCSFYRYDTPTHLFVPLMNPLMAISKILALHAVVALDEHESNLALDDIKTNLKLISGLGHQPLIVASLVSIGMNAIGGSAVYEGLSLHAWNDAQLVDLQNELAPLDFLSGYQRAIRGELDLSISICDQLKNDRTPMRVEFKEIRKSEPQMHFPNFHPDLWPDGWFDWDKVQFVPFDLTVVRFVNLGTRTVSPQVFDQLKAEITLRQNRWDARAPWSIYFLKEGGGADVMCAGMSTYAQAEVWVNETQIACALERYRLAHGVYPAALDALAPAYLGDLPHDIFNGQPYHYRLQTDGTFLLYSVGWNQKDDGGKVVYLKDNPKRTDLKQGDWVWPTPHP
jgi:hypothetical protein